MTLEPASPGVGIVARYRKSTSGALDVWQKAFRPWTDLTGPINRDVTYPLPSPAPQPLGSLPKGGLPC